MNIIKTLHTFGHTSEQIKSGITWHTDTPYPDTHSLDAWLEERKSVPDWVNRAAAKWLIELWMAERSECEANRLLAIDKKYTTYLKGFSVGEIAQMQYTLAKEVKKGTIHQ